MSDDSTSNKKPAKRRSKPRRWPKVLLFLVLFISLLVGIAQGPGLRMFIEKELRSQLNLAGIQGDFQIEGSLFSGIELRNAKLTSDGIIREFHVGYLTADYQLLEIIRGNYGKVLTEVRGDGIELWIDLDAKPTAQSTNTESRSPSTEKNTTPSTSGNQLNLETIRSYLIPVRFLINNSAVRVSRGNNLLWQASSISFTHQQQAENFHLTLGEFTDMEYESLREQDVIITWSDQGAQLQHFPLRHDTIVDQVICSWEPQWNPWIPKHAQANVQWHHGKFRLNLDKLQSARIELEEGEIHLNQLSPLLGLSGKLEGTISELDLSADNITSTPDILNAQLRGSANHLTWNEKSVNQFDVQIHIQSGVVTIDTSTQLDQEQSSQLRIETRLTESTSSDWQTCWHNLSANYKLTIPQPDNIASHVSPWIEAKEPMKAPPGGWPTGKIELHGTAGLKNQQLDTIESVLSWNTAAWGGINTRNITLEGSWNPEQEEAQAKLLVTDIAGGQIEASGTYSLVSQGYQGNLSIQSLDIAQLRPALDLLKQPVPRAGMVDLHWTSEGQVNDIQSHQGKLRTSIVGLEIEAEGEPSTDLQLTSHYDPQLNIEIDALEVTRGKLRVKTSGSWKDDTLNLSTLELHDQDALLVKGSAQLPLSSEISDLESFLRQPGDLSLNLLVNQMPLAEIYEQLPPTGEPPVKAKLTVDFKLGGSLLEPTLNLTTKAERIQVVGKDKIPLTDIDLRLVTQEQSVQLNGTATPDGHKAVLLKGQMPFHTKRWIDDPESILNEPINLTLDTKSINLAAFAHLFPHISEINGAFNSIVKLSGTVGEPRLQGNARLQISRVTSTRESIPNLRDIDIRLNYDHHKLTIAPSSCLVSGGKYSLQGAVDFHEVDNPVFDISLVADKALLWRDDAVIARSDASLRLSGPFEKADLSGDIGIVQSLFYKDVQIIPIGSGGSSGGSQRSKAELPTFTQPKTNKGDRLNIPAPFNAWTLNLSARTKDNFLIRGNIAKGQVQGGLKVTGTLGNPQPQGELTLTEGQASLPFSRLHFKESKAFFTPKNGFDPQLSIKASSRIGSYDVDVTLYGLASNPKTLMTSRPPLPENEIIFLLATGSTSDQLSDGASATGKAYQLLVDSVIRSSPSRFRRVMNTLAELNERVDINIGASDPFTGRKYNSARVDITDRWHVVASIDLDNNTRGMVVYAIQFK